MSKGTPTEPKWLTRLNIMRRNWQRTPHAMRIGFRRKSLDRINTLFKPLLLPPNSRDINSCSREELFYQAGYVLGSIKSLTQWTEAQKRKRIYKVGKSARSYDATFDDLKTFPEDQKVIFRKVVSSDDRAAIAYYKGLEAGETRTSPDDVKPSGAPKHWHFYILLLCTWPYASAFKTRTQLYEYTVKAGIWDDKEINAKDDFLKLCDRTYIRLGKRGRPPAKHRK